MGFAGDLAIGKQVEDAVIAALQKKNPLWQHGYKTAGVDKKADFRLNVGIEIKYDKLAARTGNVAIEVSCAGKPSGITATTADFWVTVLDGKESVAGIWWAEVAELRHLLLGRLAISGGDRNAVQMVLIPVDAFLQKCTLIGPTPAFLTMIR